MTQAIPMGLEKSAALRYIISKGWAWQGPNGGQVQVENCPMCIKEIGNSTWQFLLQKKVLGMGFGFAITVPARKQATCVPCKKPWEIA